MALTPTDLNVETVHIVITHFQSITAVTIALFGFQAFQKLGCAIG